MSVANTKSVLAERLNQLKKPNEEKKPKPVKNDPVVADSGYVKWGHYEDIKRIISDDMFSTLYITGMSGNGKTSMIHSICSEIDKPCFRINIIGTTDEEDLIGGYELENGNTVWKDRGVVEAMESGGVLLLDEVDLATERIMCLQSILEGEGLFVKKKKKWIYPKRGFMIVATANTKGRGSEDGKFIGTNILNEAFVDRFNYTFEQPYPPKEIEEIILLSHIKVNKIPLTDELSEFVKNLCRWAEDTRVVYFNGGAVGEVISTRRLIGIIKAYKHFGNKLKALNLALSRFDETTRNSYISYYSKIDNILG
jgi:MoxR-like ATPase